MMEAAALPLGIRNCNPGNIRFGAFAQRFGATLGEGGFARFPSFARACQAEAENLLDYYDNRKALDGSKIDTVKETIERWAPSSENNTRQYIAEVCGVLQCEEDDVFDFRNADFLFWIIKAMGYEEVGKAVFLRYVTDDEIDCGVRLALAA